MLFSHLPVRAGSRKWWRMTAVAICLLFFLDRGPYRAIRFSTTGDFSTIYAAARCLLHGENPYERAALKSELFEAGASAGIQSDQDVNPSVYLPSALVWMCMLGVFPWATANSLWTALLAVCFAFSVSAIVQQTFVPEEHRWMVWVAAFLFCPTYVGVYDGNPSVLAISLTMLALCFASRSSELISGVLLGVALCFKPQIAVCAICVFVLRRIWMPLVISSGVFAAAAGSGIALLSRGGRDWNWWHSWQRNIALSFTSGGQSDPSVHSAVAWQMLNAQTITAYLPFSHQATNFLVWVIAAGLLAVYLWKRERRGGTTLWRDAAFFAAWSLTVTYHRYYDGQLLLLLTPLIVELVAVRRVRPLAFLAGCLLILGIPWQSFLAKEIGSRVTAVSLQQVLLLRNQPIALFGLAVCLAFWCLPERTRREI